MFVLAGTFAVPRDLLDIEDEVRMERHGARTEPHGARMDYHLERKLETFEHKINEQARKTDVLLRENQKQQELIDSLLRHIQGNSDTSAVGFALERGTSDHFSRPANGMGTPIGTCNEDGTYVCQPKECDDYYEYECPPTSGAGKECKKEMAATRPFQNPAVQCRNK